MGQFSANYGANYDTSGVVVQILDSGFTPKRRVTFQDENIIIPTEIILRTEEKIIRPIQVTLKHLHRYQNLIGLRYENKIPTSLTLKTKHKTRIQNILTISEKINAPKIRMDVVETIKAHPVIRRRKEKLLNYLLLRRFHNV